jgi:UDP-glucose 4-epimerase
MKVPYEIVERRPGDVEAVYADTTKAAKDLNFKTKRGIDEMLKSAWDWEQALVKH